MKHLYFHKLKKETDGSNIVKKFDDICETENDDWITCIEENVEIKN